MSPAIRPSGSPKAFFKQMRRLLDLAGQALEAKAEAEPDKQAFSGCLSSDPRCAARTGPIGEARLAGATAPTSFLPPLSGV